MALLLSAWVLLGWGTDSFTSAHTVATFLPRLLTAAIVPVSLSSAWMLPNPPVLRYRHPHRQGQGQKRTERNPLYSTTSASASASVESSTATKPATVGGNASKSTYRPLYPPSNASSNGTIQIEGESSTHTLYYEIHGNGPLHALFLHGGPGAGCFPNHARFFDPSKYTVVLLDQRGAGRSTPRGCVDDNTLDHLVEDCERVRVALLSRSTHGNDNDNETFIQPWDCVLGGSWGATLGLAYAQRYPHSLRSLVLRGICTLRTPEVDWLFSADGGSARTLNEAWKNFSEAVGGNGNAGGGRDVLHAYYDCLVGTRTTANGTEDNSLRLTAARSWMMWEMAATSPASSRNTSDNVTARTDLVLVSSPETNSGAWRFETPQRETVVREDEDDDDDDDDNKNDFRGDPDTVAARLRRKIGSEENDARNTNRPPPTGPRPVRTVDESIPLLAAAKDSQPTPGRFQASPDYVPAQAMLTCFYSVNDRYAMGNRDLIRAESDQENDPFAPPSPPPPIRIIGIQGGSDPICPPDTAIDLLRAMQSSNSRNTMELRIPLRSGHSMYDPGIQHELIEATDRLADEFLNNNAND